MSESPPEKVGEILIIIEWEEAENVKGTVKSFFVQKKKKKKEVSELYFPTCEKLVKNKLLTFESSLLNEQITCSLNGNCYRKKAKGLQGRECHKRVEQGFN